MGFRWFSIRSKGLQLGVSKTEDAILLRPIADEEIPLRHRKDAEINAVRDVGKGCKKDRKVQFIYLNSDKFI